MFCIQVASSRGELRSVEFNTKLGRILIFIGNDCIGLDPEDYLALRDGLADAMAQWVGIHNDAQAAAKVPA